MNRYHGYREELETLSSIQV